MTDAKPVPVPQYLDDTDKAVAVKTLDAYRDKLPWYEQSAVNDTVIEQIVGVVFTAVNEARLERK